MLNLGVNIDHVATVRQARMAAKPEPLEAAMLAEKAGAWGITAHLREDRRHMQDADLALLAKQVRRLNMEMAVTDEMVRIALELRPHSSCLVPEKRQELTTEGGLDVAGQLEKVGRAVETLKAAGIVVSLFIDPDLAQLDAAAKAGADYVELHTGTYSNTARAARAAETGGPGAHDHGGHAVFAPAEREGDAELVQPPVYARIFRGCGAGG